jgi:hypothetical protein
MGFNWAFKRLKLHIPAWDKIMLSDQFHLPSTSVPEKQQLELSN